MTCLVYLDDVIVFGSTFEEELTRLDEVFSRLQSAKLKLKPSTLIEAQRRDPELGDVVRMRLEGKERSDVKQLQTAN